MYLTMNKCATWKVKMPQTVRPLLSAVFETKM